MWKWKAIKYLISLIFSIKIENDIMKIMQLGFIMTTIWERFLFISWGGKQRKLSRNYYALLVFDTLMFS